MGNSQTTLTINFNEDAAVQDFEYFKDQFLFGDEADVLKGPFKLSNIFENSEEIIEEKKADQNKMVAEGTVSRFFVSRTFDATI